MGEDGTFHRTANVACQRIAGLSAAASAGWHFDLLFLSAYEVGVRKEDGKTVFFLNDDSYPSMLAFCSSANIEGILLSDLLDPIAVFSVNGKAPEAKQ